MEGRAQFRSEKIAAVLAHPGLSDKEKVLIVAILNTDHSP